MLYLRHKLQKGFLAHDHAPKAVELSDLSMYIRKLEEATRIEAEVLLGSKIHKVLIAICKCDSIPGDEEFKFRERSETLIAKWRKILDDSRVAHQMVQEESTSGTRPKPQPKPVEPQPPVREPVVALSSTETNSTPTLCITQYSRDQCAKMQSLAQACDPPLDRAVVELMCMLPRFSAPNEHETYQIVSFGQIFDPLIDLEKNTFNERRFDGWGPAIPSHVVQLTDFVDGRWGRALYLDTKTGEGIIFKEYEVKNYEDRDPQWQDLVGERKPAEELLQGWIDDFLEGKFMPSGGSETVHEEGPRYIVEILMVSPSCFLRTSIYSASQQK